MGVMGGCWFPALLWTGQPVLYPDICKYRAQELCRKQRLGSQLDAVQAKSNAKLPRKICLGRGWPGLKAFQRYEEKETPASASPAQSTQRALKGHRAHPAWDICTQVSPWGKERRHPLFSQVEEKEGMGRAFPNPRDHLQLLLVSTLTP